MDSNFHAFLLGGSPVGIKTKGTRIDSSASIAQSSFMEVESDGSSKDNYCPQSTQNSVRVRLNEMFS